MPEPSAPYVLGELTADYDARRVTLGGSPVQLTPIEYRTLAELTANTGRVLTYEHLLQRVRGAEPDDDVLPMASEQRDRLDTIDGELEEVKKQLGRVWQFIAKSDSVDVAEASDLIVELRQRKETLEITAEEAKALLKERRQLLDSADTIAAFAEDMSEFLETSELTETRAFVHSFVKEVQVKPGRAAIIYSMPTPDDSPIGGADAAEIALNGRVMNSVLPGGQSEDRTHDTRNNSPVVCLTQLTPRGRWLGRRSPPPPTKALGKRRNKVKRGYLSRRRNR